MKTKKNGSMNSPMRAITTTMVSVVALLMAVSATQAATVAQYNFDSIVSQTVSDITGNGHDATFSPPVSLSTDNPFGQLGNMSLDVSLAPHSEGVIASPGTIALLPGNKFTMETWIKPTDVGTTHLVLELRNSLSASQAIVRSIAGGYFAQFQSTGGSQFVLNGNSSVPSGVWSHLAYVYDGTAMHVYLNGVEDATALTINQTVDATFASATIANIASTLIDLPFKGLMDDARISDVALAPSQLGFHGSFTIPEPSSVALLAFGLLVLRCVVARRCK